MTAILTLPDLGLGDTPITASMWLAELGDSIAAGDRLLEVLADGVTVDLPAPADGVLQEMLVEEDERLTVGQPLAVVSSGQ